MRTCALEVNPFLVSNNYLAFYECSITIYLDKEQYQISSHSILTFSLKSKNIWRNLPFALTLTFKKQYWKLMRYNTYIQNNIFHLTKLWNCAKTRAYECKVASFWVYTMQLDTSTICVSKSKLIISNVINSESKVPVYLEMSAQIGTIVWSIRTSNALII